MRQVGASSSSKSDILDIPSESLNQPLDRLIKASGGTDLSGLPVKSKSVVELTDWGIVSSFCSFLSVVHSLKLLNDHTIFGNPIYPCPRAVILDVGHNRTGKLIEFHCNIHQQFRDC